MEWSSCKKHGGSMPQAPVQQPVVEGMHPTQADLDAKARNGRYYLSNIGLITNEYITPHVYEIKNVDIEHMTLFVEERVLELGCVAVDSSHRLNGVTHALQLAEAWHTLVREARTTNVLHIIRRTPQNSGAVLMIQRQEHLRGNCSEWTPMALMALVRSEQLMLQRHEIEKQRDVEDLIVQFATEREKTDDDGAMVANGTSDELARAAEAVAAVAAAETVAADLENLKNATDESNPGLVIDSLHNSAKTEDHDNADSRPAKLKIEENPELNMPKEAFTIQIEGLHKLMKACFITVKIFLMMQPRLAMPLLQKFY